jgi:hypothetical protein
MALVTNPTEFWTASFIGDPTIVLLSSGRPIITFPSPGACIVEPFNQLRGGFWLGNDGPTIQHQVAAIGDTIRRHPQSGNDTTGSTLFGGKQPKNLFPSAKNDGLNCIKNIATLAGLATSTVSADQMAGLRGPHFM